MPDWLNVILLGIVEGITEFLPVSSTGHLLIVERWLHARSDLFNIVIQCGAVIAVIPLFPERLKQLLRWRDPAGRDYLFKLATAFFITGVGGFILEKKHFKLPEEPTPVAWALLIGGVAFVLVEQWLKGRKTSELITWQIAIAIGFAQLLAAAFPGTSRSGATIVAALAFGLSRPAATEFSFLVGIPTMLAAGGYKIFKAFHHPVAGTVPENWSMVILCTLVSAVVSFIAVRWLLRYIQTHTFTAFGWYRIAIGLACLLFLR